MGKRRILGRIALVTMCYLIVLSFFCSPPQVQAANYSVTIYLAGLPPTYTTIVSVSDALGKLEYTVYGGGLLTIQNRTAGSMTVSVFQYLPSSLPYYPGYPYPIPYPYRGLYGFEGVSFYCPQNSASFSHPGGSYTFRYYMYFFLGVQSERGYPTGMGWYPAGSWATASVTTTSDEDGETRYRFDYWKNGDLGSSYNTPSITILMDAPRTVSAVWAKQHRLRIDSAYGGVSGDGWYDAGKTASFSVSSPIEGFAGTRYVFSSWSGDYSGTSPTGSMTMDSPRKITANWKTQYFLAIDPNGGVVDKASQWVDSGGAVTVTATSPCNIITEKSRWVFANWSNASADTSPTTAVTVNMPKTLVANWKTQFYLAVNSACLLYTSDAADE